MNKIPMQHAFESGAWFKCETKEYQFKLRTLSFDRIPLDLVEGISEIPLDEGILYVLKIEVVNLTKTAIDAWRIRTSILLIDQDDFAFSCLEGRHLTDFSDFAKSTGLKRFSGGDSLQPKTKVSGALAFLLPDDEQAKYCLYMKDGKIQEV